MEALKNNETPNQNENTQGERVDADFIRHLGSLAEEAAGANYDKKYSSHHRKSNGDTLAS